MSYLSKKPEGTNNRSNISNASQAARSLVWDADYLWKGLQDGITWEFFSGFLPENFLLCPYGLRITSWPSFCDKLWKNWTETGLEVGPWATFQVQVYKEVRERTASTSSSSSRCCWAPVFSAPSSSSSFHRQLWWELWNCYYYPSPVSRAWWLQPWQLPSTGEPTAVTIKQSPWQLKASLLCAGADEQDVKPALTLAPWEVLELAYCLPGIWFQRHFSAQLGRSWQPQQGSFYQPQEMRVPPPGLSDQGLF